MNLDLKKWSSNWPSGENLLDKASSEKLPPLYSGEELGLDALAQVEVLHPG